MGQLLVELLHPDAKTPTVGHPGEDLGYDLYSIEDVILQPGVVTMVRTGVALHFEADPEEMAVYGLILKDRSSMALKGITSSAGVIDSGYTKEVIALLTLSPGPLRLELYFCEDDDPKVRIIQNEPFLIKAGSKIIQAVPRRVEAGVVNVVDHLPGSSRGSNGFGSTGA